MEVRADNKTATDPSCGSPVASKKFTTDSSPGPLGRRQDSESSSHPPGILQASSRHAPGRPPSSWRAAPAAPRPARRPAFPVSGARLGVGVGVGGCITAAQRPGKVTPLETKKIFCARAKGPRGIFGRLFSARVDCLHFFCQSLFLTQRKCTQTSPRPASPSPTRGHFKPPPRISSESSSGRKRG